MSDLFGSGAMPVPITAVYAALLTVVSTVLAFRIGTYRNQVGISILHGDDMELAQRIRRHANFTETVPIALILMLAIELNGASTTLLNVVGGVLLVSRVLHPMGLHHDQISHPLRAAGAFGTLAATLLAAGTALYQVA